MGKGGGGGYDTSGLEEAAKKSNALQEKIYEQTREDVQPWYNMGVGSVNKLSDLMGVSGGSVQSRDQLYDELLPQYTTSTTTNASGGEFYKDRDGNIIGIEAVNKLFNPIGRGAYWNEFDDGQLQSIGVTRMGGQPVTSESIDYAGLNSALDSRLADQGTPEGYGSLLETFDMNKFEEDAGFKYRQDEANKQLERQMAAQGITLGGAGYGEINPAAYKGMQELNQGLASQEYGAARGRYVGDQLNKFNMLMGTAGMGQNSTNTMAGAGQNYAQSYSDTVQGLASAQQNAQLAQASKPSMFGQLMGGLGQIGAGYAGSTAGSAALTGLFSDINLKENIKLIGKENGFPTYKFNYINIPEKTYIGVMAQDVEKLRPEAVGESEGYKTVNYDMIDIKMREVD